MTGREDSTCPYARGFLPQELECRLLRSHERAVGVPWYRRLWHDIRGDYCCPHEGFLPCRRFNDLSEATL